MNKKNYGYIYPPEKTRQQRELGNIKNALKKYRDFKKDIDYLPCMIQKKDWPICFEKRCYNFWSCEVYRRK